MRKACHAAEAEIRNIMFRSDSVVECQDELDKAGYSYITVREQNGVNIASLDIDNLVSSG